MKRLTRFLRGNFEKLFIVGGIAAAAFITYYTPSSISFLNFFFLPVILAGYFSGLRLSVPGAVFCIAIVVFYAVVSPSHFLLPQGGGQVAFYVLSWGGFLVLAGAAVGYQQEKINIERHGLRNVYDNLQESLEKLKKARAETVIGLATLTECRDRDTGLHLERVGEFCRIIAEELRRTPPLDSYITDEYVEDLVLSSVLHDIGKVAIPDSILLKTGKLSDEEFDIMRTHAAAGGDALTAIEAKMQGRSFFTLGKQIAYNHHERWDGRGYPRGLSGESIPLSARIVSVADTYDAITCDRPYRAALPHEEALRRIREERGTQFDPRIVDAFMARQADILHAKAALEQSAPGDLPAGASSKKGAAA